MINAFTGEVRVSGGLSEDEPTLKDRLSVAGKALGSPVSGEVTLLARRLMSASSVAAWPKMLAAQASRIAGALSCTSCVMVPTRQVYSNVSPPMIPLRKSR